jgi:hypothetical protein
VEEQELNITARIISEILSEKELKKLRLLLGSVENYQKFLATFLRILIEKEKSISLTDFFEIHALEGKENSFPLMQRQAVEELAELAWKGHSSENILWLQETQQKIFSEHLSFFQETRKGIEKTERSFLKERMAFLEKMKGFDLSENQIKAGIIILERKNLKAHFSVLAEKEKKYTKTEKSPSRLTFATVLLLLAASGAILAVSIPGIRNFIKKEVKELFMENKPVEIPKSHQSPASGTNPPAETPFSGIDSIAPTEIDQNIKAPEKFIAKTAKTEIKKEVPQIIPKEDVINPLVVNEAADLKNYQQYFREHKNELDPIESTWTLNGKIGNYPENPVYLTCAIRKTEGNNYEVVYFAPDGKKAKLHFVSLVIGTGDLTRYELRQYRNDSLVSKHSMFITEKGTLKFSSHFVLGDFADVTPEKKSEQVECAIVGKRKK